MSGVQEIRRVGAEGREWLWKRTYPSSWSEGAIDVEEADCVLDGSFVQWWYHCSGDRHGWEFVCFTVCREGLHSVDPVDLSRSDNQKS